MFIKLLANSIRWRIIHGIVLVLTLSALMNIFTLKTANLKQSTGSDVGESPVKIGIVTCSGRINVTHFIATFETLTLIKSVIISASLHRVKSIDFHIFVDSYDLQIFLDKIISEFSFNKIGSTVNVGTYFYNVFKSVPPGQATEFLKTDIPCTFVRIFFPNVLSHLDDLLYLDTDTIVTGNIGQIWEKLQKLGNQKLVALAPNNEPEDENFRDLDALNFGTIPHVPPKGVNAGVFYMNLAGLREFGWTDILLETYKKYTKNGRYINDQHLINIALSDRLDILELLPCHYNFQSLHCDRGLTCKAANDDPTGIQILHGAGDSFYRHNLSHRHFFATYTEFDLGAPVNIIDDLLKPVKEHNVQERNSSTYKGVLGPMLFKDILL